MKRVIISLLLVTLLFFTGCNNDQPASTEINKGNNQIEENPNNDQSQLVNDNSRNEEEEIAKYIVPLTGLAVDNEVNKRAFGVMIDNQKQARPQSGLIQADIVYELLAEGPITRFVAIFHSKESEIIGPVRSIRPYNLDIINGFDALIVHSGSSQDALEILQTTSLPDIDEIYNSPSAFWRTNTRKMPNNLYTSSEKIENAAAKKNYRLEGNLPNLIFLDEDTEIKGETAEDITIKYYSDYMINYLYNEDTKLYERSINGQPHIDLETMEQLTARNILVIEAQHKIYDNEGRRVIDVFGPGEGYLFQNGKVKLITWERKDGIIRAYIDGEEQGLYPGQTWIIVIEPRSTVTYK